MQDIGKLDKRITIGSLSTTIDEYGGAYGQPFATYTTSNTVWAFMRELSGLEKTTDAQQVSYSRVEFTIRHIDDLNTKMQVQYGSRKFNIIHIKHSEYSRNDYITLLTEEVIL